MFPVMLTRGLCFSLVGGLPGISATQVKSLLGVSVMIGLGVWWDLCWCFWENCRVLCCSGWMSAGVPFLFSFRSSEVSVITPLSVCLDLMLAGL